MKTSNRKKIIIGYRYDPNTNAIERLHEVQAIDDCCDFSLKSYDHVYGKFSNESEIIRSLRNQNLLLKAEIERVQQQTSFRSYQFLASEHQNLQKQCHSLKIEIEALKQRLNSAQPEEKPVKVEKSTKHSSEEIHQIERNQSWKYTFSPYHNLNSQERLPKFSEQENDFSEKSSKFPSSNNFIALKTPPEMNESFVNKIISERFLQNEGEKSSSFGQINTEQIARFNHFQSLEKQLFNNNNGFSPQEYFQGINSEYLYNDLRTIQSQKSNELSKSQQMQSMVQLDANFSFMPKPLKKNQQSMKILSNTSKKVSFNQEANMMYSSKDFSFSNNSGKESHHISHQSLSVELNNDDQNGSKNGQIGLAGLNGLKKLPSKPKRLETQSSDLISDQ